MALKMQTYDDPTDTWTDVVSVMQEVVGAGVVGVAVREVLPIGCQDVPWDSPVTGLAAFERVSGIFREFNPIAKHTL